MILNKSQNLKNAVAAFTNTRIGYFVSNDWSKNLNQLSMKKIPPTIDPHTGK